MEVDYYGFDLSTFWRIAIVVSLNAHSLDEFWTLDQINWTLPAPGLKMKVFFRKEKKLLLQGSRGLTMVYLPYNSGV